MLSMQARTRIIALAAVATVSTASAGVASAATVQRAIRPVTGTVVAPTSTPSVARPVTAGATGDGPATQKDCDNYADAINSWTNAGVGENNADEALHDFKVSDQIKNQAMDDGCFIVY
jgi:hypothetical protein